MDILPCMACLQAGPGAGATAEQVTALIQSMRRHPARNLQIFASVVTRLESLLPHASHVTPGFAVPMLRALEGLMQAGSRLREEVNRQRLLRVPANLSGQPYLDSASNHVILAFLRHACGHASPLMPRHVIEHAATQDAYADLYTYSKNLFSALRTPFSRVPYLNCDAVVKDAIMMMFGL